MTPGSVIVASVGSGPQLPHTDGATNPEVLPPDNRNISGCHLSSFLCLSHLEEYQVAVQAGTALRDAEEVQWDAIQLQRGGRGRGCPLPHEGVREGVRCAGGVHSK